MTSHTIASAPPLGAETERVENDPASTPREQWASRYRAVRGLTEKLCASLEPEDFVVQSMPDASPAKWHLAHTSWFFETFVLKPGLAGYRASDPVNEYLFNSYYNAVGPMHCRALRGMISRPTVAQTCRYRERIDVAMERWFAGASDEAWRRLQPIVELGLHHEQQHQELLLTDLKHMFAQNPLYPAYRPAGGPHPARGSNQTDDAPAADRRTEGRLPSRPVASRAGPAAGKPPLRQPAFSKQTGGAGADGNSRDAAAPGWFGYPEGVFEIGHAGGAFHFDNEGPRHRVFVQAFQLASRLVTNGEFVAFIEDGGYERPELWLSLGWMTVRDQKWRSPLYWENRDGGGWQAFTLHGMQPLEPAAPACHVSYFEADAFARWAGARLPTEAEWEVASEAVPLDGNFVEDERLHPAPAAPRATPGPVQMFGDVWEWTRSAYAPYPGFNVAAGAIGEYNGKFMCNQYVLRGGSCATSRSHIRRTYRNFFPPEKRWQFTGIRLAKDAA